MYIYDNLCEYDGYKCKYVRFLNRFKDADRYNLPQEELNATKLNQMY